MENNESTESSTKKSSSSKKERVVVVSTVRTPFVKSFGVFEQETALSLSLRVDSEVISKTGVQASDIDECIWGVVIPQTKNANLAREIVLFSGLPTTIAGFTLNKACNSSLQTAEIAADRILLGKNKLVLAGGVEVLSDVPIPFSDEARRFLTKMSRARSFKERLSLIGSVNPKWFLPKPPALAEPFTGLTMGEHAEIMTVKNNVSRARQDELAYKSHINAASAIEAGHLKDEIVPVTIEEVYLQNNKRKTRSFVVDTDEGPRKDTSVEGLAKLKAVFAAKGSVTAGNSSQTSDGAAFVLVMSEKMVKELNIEPIARLVTSAVVGCEPRVMGIGPVVAIPQALKQAGLKQEDIEMIELNEAFAAQSLAVIRTLGLNPDIINPNGGAIALGHPLGCSGAKLSVQLINEMRRQNKRYGMVSACIGGGQGIAGIIERLK
mgnify:CR=1 FL=1